MERKEKRREFSKFKDKFEPDINRIQHAKSIVFTKEVDIKNV